MGEAVLTSTHNLCFELKKKKCHNFSSENYCFAAMKYCRILHRHVCVMLLQIQHEETQQLCHIFTDLKKLAVHIEDHGVMEYALILRCSEVRKRLNGIYLRIN